MSVDEKEDRIVQIAPTPPGWFALQKLDDEPELVANPIAVWALVEDSDGMQGIKGYSGDEGPMWMPECGLDSFVGYVHESQMSDDEPASTGAPEDNGSKAT